MKNNAIPITMGNKKKAIPISSAIRKASNIYHPVRCVYKPIKIINISETSLGALLVKDIK
jgi:hypothetical protein